MELASAEIVSLKKLVEYWFTHPEIELEATFGIKGQVDAQTFLETANRLRAKGYNGVPQQDRLNVCLPDQIRFTLTNIGLIEQYCRDNKMNGKPFISMIKDRTSGPESNVDLREYDIRIKARRELAMDKSDPRVVDLLAKWDSLRKAFRLIRRWTFQGEGIKFDMSMVRSTPRDPRGEFKWVRKFQDFNIRKSNPIYEIEVELEREKFTSPDDAFTALMKGVGEVQRGIQKHFILIRNSVTRSVIEEYKALVGTDRFRGVAPITMTKENMISEIEDGTANIRSGYNVTDKADGLRCMGFCDASGELFLIDIGLKVYRTGLRSKKCANSLVDGEWITRDRNGTSIQMYAIFDIYIASSKQIVSNKPFQGTDGRYKAMQTWIESWNNDKKGPENILKTANLKVGIKKFYFATKDTSEIFARAQQMLKEVSLYNTDGLIFSPNLSPIPDKPRVGWKEQFKWKPAADNTVDFLVKIEKDVELTLQDKITLGVHPTRGAIRYKTLRLFVGSEYNPAFDDPRATILFEQPIKPPPGPVKDIRKIGMKRSTRIGEYQPVLFNPKEYPDTMANVCFLEVEIDPATQEEYVQTEHTHEPIRDMSIVEMRYDPLRPAGWRWIPTRVRADKTDRFQRGELDKTLNSDFNAETVWNSIHDPITKSMITTGTEEPTEDEMKQLIKPEAEAIKKKYFERKATNASLLKVKGLRDFHKKAIKEDILYMAAFKEKSGKVLIDLGTGRGADLHRWDRGQASFVLGIDEAGDNIRNKDDGAYRRYLNTLIKKGRDRIAPMVFVIGDGSKNLVNGDAGDTPEEQDILRSIFGKVQPQGTIPPYIEKTAAGRLRRGADIISCMFAAHYFFESETKCDSFLKNISDNLKLGGYFICCLFDGDRVFDYLRKTPIGQSKVGQDDENTLWTITKRYNTNEITEGSDGFGLAIDVEFVTIGSPHREYLVPKDVLYKKLKEIGLELITKDEAMTLGVPSGTESFETTYLSNKKNQKEFFMIDSVKEFSFLSRWYIFKRRSMGSGAPEPAPQEISDAIAASAKSAKPVKVSATGERIVEINNDEEGEEEDEVEGAEAVAAERTIAPPAPTAVPKAVIAARNQTYAANEVFQFSLDSDLNDKLKIGDKGAARWLAPAAPFPIVDPTDSKVVYPSIEHFLAAMRFKLASNKPLIASTYFSRLGEIHQKFNKQREIEKAEKKFTEDRDFDLLREESEAVKRAQLAGALKTYGATIDDAKWTSIKQEMLHEAVKQRIEKDARLRKIIDAAREKYKYLLYQVKAIGNDLGGKRRADGHIEGENRYGKMLMTLAGGF